MLTTMIRTVSALFCHHEWVRRRTPGRMYLECVNCLATTQGIEIAPQRQSPVLVGEGRLSTVKAA